MNSKPSILKRVVFTLVLVVLLLGGIEGSAHIYYFLRHGELFSFSSWNQSIQSAADLELPGDANAGKDAGFRDDNKTIEVLHPYLGFVVDPYLTPGRSQLGFKNRFEESLWSASGEKLNVLILGGSFAAGVAEDGEKAITESLADRGYDVRVMNYAVGGYKQPQQLHTLTELLALGASIDVVVNIDGFNEVALSPAENMLQNVNPFYPRAWLQRTTGIYDQITQRRIGHVVYLEEKRRQWANRFSRFPKYSVVRGLVWQGIDNQLQGQVADLCRLLQEEDSDKATRHYLSQGPEMGFETRDDFFTAAANHWANCSVLINSLCQTENITYIHAIQPNQYVEGSKSLTEEEQQTAFNESHPYKEGVDKGYPRLLDSADILFDNAINFLDLTMLYSDVSQTLYIDDCCHTNTLGYAIVADEIASKVADLLDSRAGSDDSAIENETAENSRSLNQINWL